MNAALRPPADRPDALAEFQREWADILAELYVRDQLERREQQRAKRSRVTAEAAGPP